MCRATVTVGALMLENGKIQRLLLPDLGQCSGNFIYSCFYLEWRDTLQVAEHTARRSLEKLLRLQSSIVGDRGVCRDSSLAGVGLASIFIYLSLADFVSSRKTNHNHFLLL
ncbi:hypothetical protein BU23DRAFT_299756 [Bimuria novae-zelandiae CBS 107.79]|uniref:Uncharacterized protein n=1 Tax=Bimuria novae-zelandiae CBS 107.79 TaxID=1447943 RepID=A0A6A5VL12_9PLEO|nr:hypothetical protein BU23DRAFT_299756 [Bimuria novae-zelandiae CBS 107.79]